MCMLYRPTIAGRDHSISVGGAVHRLLYAQSDNNLNVQSQVTMRLPYNSKVPLLLLNDNVCLTRDVRLASISTALRLCRRAVRNRLSIIAYIQCQYITTFPLPIPGRPMRRTRNTHDGAWCTNELRFRSSHGLYCSLPMKPSHVTRMRRDEFV